MLPPLKFWVTGSKALPLAAFSHGNANRKGRRNVKLDNNYDAADPQFEFPMTSTCRARRELQV